MKKVNSAPQYTKQLPMANFVNDHPDMAIAGAVVLGLLVFGLIMSKFQKQNPSLNPTAPDLLSLRSMPSFIGDSTVPAVNVKIPLGPINITPPPIATTCLKVH